MCRQLADGSLKKIVKYCKMKSAKNHKYKTGFVDKCETYIVVYTEHIEIPRRYSVSACNLSAT